jgi:prophage antirepressor-like protein
LVDIMNNSSINFEFDTNTIRVIEIEGEPWFVAPDALNAMGYTQGNYAGIRRKLGGQREGYETDSHPWRTSEHLHPRRRDRGRTMVRR